MIIIPSKDDFLKGCEEYEKHEKRDAMYKVAMFLVSHFWGQPEHMADGLGVLLLTWNQAFYRYGIFDFYKLEKCIADNFQVLENIRERDISSLIESDEKNIKDLFIAFLRALEIKSADSRKSSPVAVAKALHILGPNFFPLWDKAIAHNYGINFKNPSEEYLTFCKITKEMANKIKDYVDKPQKPLIRLIDEYNYSRFTKKWIN